METAQERTIQIIETDPYLLVGHNDASLKIIEQSFPDTVIVVRGNQIILKGDTETLDRVESIFTELILLLKTKPYLSSDDVKTVVRLSALDAYDPTKRTEHLSDVVLLTKDNGIVAPKTEGQKRYIGSILKNDVVFSIGPAGTGKTYLAVAIAVAALKNKEISKIVLTRPAVEAGESLGFLPGDLNEKINPYIRPLHDALYDMLPTDTLKKYLGQKVIEIIPLAYMRGRTLNNAFLILDEAQNSTAIQMKMFLTRLGVNSKCVITGDVTQIDLKESRASGLVEIQKILQNIEGIEFVYLDKSDIVRHKLVKDIIQAYDRFDSRTADNSSG